MTNTIPRLVSECMSSERCLVEINSLIEHEKNSHTTVTALCNVKVHAGTGMI